MIELVLGGADVVVIKLPVTYSVTILQLKEQLYYAALASECGFDEVQLFAAKLKLLRGGTLLDLWPLAKSERGARKTRGAASGPGALSPVSSGEQR